MPAAQLDQTHAPGHFGLIVPLSAFEAVGGWHRPKFQYRGRLYYKLSAGVNQRGNFDVQAVWGRRRPGTITELHPDDQVREWFQLVRWRVTNTITGRLSSTVLWDMADSASSSGTVVFNADCANVSATTTVPSYG